MLDVSCALPSAEIKQLSTVNGVLFPEFILDIADDNSSINSSDNEQTDDLSISKNVDDNSKFCVEELEQLTANSTELEDCLFDKFKKSIKKRPKQVLRYCLGGSPLWVTDKNVLPLDTSIPNCSKCGAKRQFEFQVMPQLLNHLELDDVGNSIDWATLVIYTCSEDCYVGGQYGREYLWKQDF